MGLFDLFKKNQSESKKATIPEQDKKYYQQDSYYTDTVFTGTQFEKKVVLFENRKKTAIPSKTGLYPAEILLLEYCSYGKYPAPKHGYPSFWWFEYGIRDVGAALKDLEVRGYIAFASAKDSLNSLTMPQLKEMLSTKELPTTGKKSDLVLRVADAFSEAELTASGIQVKYMLTDLGQRELAENAYVPYMHKNHNKTVEDNTFGMPFNVWSINKLLGAGDKSNWKSIVEAQEAKLNQQRTDNHSTTMRMLSNFDPELFKILKMQDEQLEAIQKARMEYDENKDIGSYIAFWEMLWNNGGLAFRGSRWHFELADLYIASKRYGDALRFVKELKKERKEYTEKADSYIAKIEALIAKQASKKK